MRLKVTRSKNSASLYVIKSIYDSKTQSNSSKIVEKLGTEAELREKLHGKDPYVWANEYIKKLNRQEKEQKRRVLVPFQQSTLISMNEQHFYNGGYLFLKALYHSLGIHRICKAISGKYKFTFNLDSILSRLIYGRILFPSSKLNTFQLAGNLLEQPDFELHHIYRALEFLAKENDFIQSELYRNSLAISKRNDKILYYDCTNFFFEIEQEDGLRQYGPSKEHRPSPIVEMGLFMDGDGIPLAFSIHEGNKNEQLTLKPLEQKILRDFSLSKFIVCTDAGLSSTDNRKFNNVRDRAFITTQSIKKLKKHLRIWALDPTGWKLPGDKNTYDIGRLKESEETIERYRECTFYKERWMKEDGLEQNLVVTFSLKYKYYQKNIREKQVERARKIIKERPGSLKTHNQNDCKRFISKIPVTVDGEIVKEEVYSLNEEMIAQEALYDGFYAVCTNLEDDGPAIAKVNHRRWEIEECFRIMKEELRARPVYLSRDDRIRAHFITCFLALVIYRYLERKLDNRFTADQIITTLKDMNFFSASAEGYIPTYTRTDLTDALHEAFGFRTDYQIVSTSQMKKIYKDTKK